MSGDPHALTTVESIRAIVGEPNAATEMKLQESLDDHPASFIRLSPFCLLATANAEGQPDVSPKGDEPGFVTVADANTLLVPERSGNKLIYSLQNLLVNPRVGLLFLVPGTEETLRVQGTATLTSDPEILAGLSARGRPALLAIRVAVERCFFHCAKAFKRSRLWKPHSWPAKQRVSFGDIIAARVGGAAEIARQIDEFVEADYKENL